MGTKRQRGEIAVIKKVQIYKRDKYNMLTVEVQGKSLVVREISDAWGEECHTFLSRPEMLAWAESRFQADRLEGGEAEREAILEKFRSI
ncbi:MAG: hypothetical protein C6W55_05640 [Thermobacillus sp.]|nr:MAG: hypothetical protein C6W55_05640 [Thermobacillus sp.]